MNIILQCDICKSEIKNLAVVVKDVCYRKDLVIPNYETDKDLLREVDRRYAAGRVDKLIYNCLGCKKEIIINQSECDKNLHDFIRNYEIKIDDLKSNKYNSLIIIKKEN